MGSILEVDTEALADMADTKFYPTRRFAREQLFGLEMLDYLRRSPPPVVHGRCEDSGVESVGGHEDRGTAAQLPTDGRMEQYVAVLRSIYVGIRRLARPRSEGGTLPSTLTLSELQQVLQLPEIRQHFLTLPPVLQARVVQEVLGTLAMRFAGDAMESENPELSSVLWHYPPSPRLIRRLLQEGVGGDPQEAGQRIFEAVQQARYDVVKILLERHRVAVEGDGDDGGESTDQGS